MLQIGQKRLPLLHGACVVLMSDIDMQDPSTFWDFVARHSVNYLDTTPSLLAAMIEAAPAIRASCIGWSWGERKRLRGCSLDCVNGSGKTPMTNTYGPTECCIDATACVLDDILTRDAASRSAVRLLNTGFMFWTAA